MMYWIRRNAEPIAILLAITGLFVVVATEPTRERAFITAAVRG